HCYIAADDGDLYRLRADDAGHHFLFRICDFDRDCLTRSARFEGLSVRSDADASRTGMNRDACAAIDERNRLGWLIEIGRARIALGRGWRRLVSGNET